MGAFETFVNTELPLRTAIAGLPTADRYARFTGVGRAVEERTIAQMLGDLTFTSVSSKATPIAADRVLIEDSADSYAKKYTTLTKLLEDVTGAVTSVFGRTGAVVATAGDYDAFHYTESEVDGLFTTHAASADHDGRYYTEGETDSAIDADIATHTAIATAHHGTCILADGTQALTADWNVGAFKVTTQGLDCVDGQFNVREGDIVFRYISDTVRPRMKFARHRAGSTAVQSGDELGRIEFHGYGTAQAEGAAIAVEATETWDGTSHGCDMRFTAAADGTAPLTEVLRLQSVVSAVNYLNVTNSATGNSLQLFAAGTDTDIDISVVPKGAGVFTVAGHILCERSDEIQFRDSGQAMWSSAANTLDINAATTVNMNIGGALEATWAADTLTFNSGAQDIELYWGHEGELRFTINTIREMELSSRRLLFDTGLSYVEFGWSTNGQLTFRAHGSTEITYAANVMTFNNGLTDTGFYWGVSGELAFQVGGGNEMRLTANALTFNNGATSTSLVWTNNGVLHFKVGSTAEAYLWHLGFDVTNLISCQSLQMDGDAGGVAATITLTNVTASPSSSPVSVNPPTGYTTEVWVKEYVGTTIGYRLVMTPT